MTAETMSYSKDGFEFTIDVRGNILQEYNSFTGTTTKFYEDAKEVYYPSLRMIDRFKKNRYGEFVLDYSTFIDVACLGLKVWYDAAQVPSSFAIGEIVTNSEYSAMHYSQRKPLLDIFKHKVEKFIAHWRAGEFYDVSLLVTKITPQDKTTQKSFSDKVVKSLPVL